MTSFPNIDFYVVMAVLTFAAIIILPLYILGSIVERRRRR